MGICLVSVANGTETVAVPQDDGTYMLYGYKWFSSATDADVTLTVARVQNPDGSTVAVSTNRTIWYQSLSFVKYEVHSFPISKETHKHENLKVPSPDSGMLPV